MCFSDIEDFADEPDTFYQVKSVQNKFLILQPPRLRGQILSSDVRWKWFYESEEVCMLYNFLSLSFYCLF